jgi:hypothetical protein
VTIIRSVTGISFLCVGSTWNPLYKLSGNTQLTVVNHVIPQCYRILEVFLPKGGGRGSGEKWPKPCMHIWIIKFFKKKYSSLQPHSCTHSPSSLPSHPPPTRPRTYSWNIVWSLHKSQRQWTGLLCAILIHSRGSNSRNVSWHLLLMTLHLPIGKHQDLF